MASSTCSYFSCPSFPSMSSVESVPVSMKRNEWTECNSKFRNFTANEPIIRELFVLLEQQQYPRVPKWISHRKLQGQFSYYSIDWEDFFVVILMQEKGFKLSITKTNSNEPSIFVQNVKSLVEKLWGFIDLSSQKH
jgi:hypothetical protein